MHTYNTFLDVLTLRMKNEPKKIAFTFLEDGEEKEHSVTYEELYTQVISLASLLQKQDVHQRSILLLFHSGLEYIIAFLATLYAGAIAVPAYPPKNNKNLERFHSIIGDCDPVLILSTQNVRDHSIPIFASEERLNALQWVTTNEIENSDARNWVIPNIGADDVAFLQYTSGSTANAKGVMVTHRNLLHNEKMIQNATQASQEDIGVAWLPIFHDMGLIGMILQPLYVGFRVYFMAPASFLQRPIRWLNAMSRYKATMTVAPNFGLDVCAKTLNREDCIHLDLSNLRFLMCGAEPINPMSVQKFTDLLEPYGWDIQAFKPAFGLAEATLMVSATENNSYFEIDCWDTKELQEGHLIHSDAEDHTKIVSAGVIAPELKVRIVNTLTDIEADEKEIGEIVVSGESVAKGYWKNETATQETFGYMMTDKNGNVDGPYMRTGDLGYMKGSTLYIAGRTKDLIIIAGKNYYPQDIEWSVENALSDTENQERLIQIGGCAAFSIHDNGNEKLVVVAEITRHFLNLMKNDKEHQKVSWVINMIRREISRVHQIQVHDIVLIKPTTLPKTSSGKIQRKKTQQMYLNQNLQQANSSILLKEAHTKSMHSEISKDALKVWLLQKCSELLEIPALQITVHEDLALYGFSSILAMRLHGMLEDHLDRKLPQELLWEASSIEEIVTKIADIKENEQDRNATIVSIALDQHEPFMLNPIQEAYWLGRNDYFEFGGVGCHFYGEFEQSGIDTVKLERSWNQLILRHPMLRAIIDENGNQRVLHETPYYNFASIDISSLELSDKNRCIDEIRGELSHKKYDASQWPLFEIRTTRIDEQTTRIHFSYDLLIGDIWSLKLLYEEWGVLYYEGENVLEPIEISFRDYTMAYEERKGDKGYKKALEYWNSKIATLPEAPKLPENQTATTNTAPLFRRREKIIEKKIWDKLKLKGQNFGIMPSVLLCSAYADILAAWSQTRHFTLNLTLFNREPLHKDVMKLVGDFTTLLLLEVDNRSFDSFKERSLRLQERLRQDLAHKSVNGIEVMQKMAQCQGKNAASMPIVFTSALGFEDMMSQKYGEWLGQSIYSISQTPQVWLDHQTREENGALLFTWDSLDELFSPNVVDEMFGTYTRLLELLAASDAAWDDTMMCLTPGDQIADFKSYMPISANQDVTMYERFLKQCQINPDAIAIITPAVTLSYKELYHRAQCVAKLLIDDQVPQGELVAIVLEKGIYEAIAALGIMMAGCAYVPIDAATPHERVELLIKLAASRLILTQSHIINESGYSAKTIALDKLDYTQTVAEVYDKASAESLAYVIFTSGSTGVPKGVMIAHKSAANTIDDINTRFSIQSDDRIFGVSSFAFDLSVYDLFGALSVGATLVLPDPSMGIDPKHFASMMNEHGVTVWNSAPALMHTFLEYVQATPNCASSTLQHVLLSGDWIAPHLPQLIKSYFSQASVTSLGGATEASIWSIAYDTDVVNAHCRSIPYGKALSNQKIFILGDKLEPRPTWVTGDIYIAGDGLAMGYYKDEQKTDEKFILHPMSGVRLYKTGDLGRVLPDGNVEFLGRKDFQVKISGYRIELGEIEHVIEQHPSVEYTIVTTFKDHNDVHRIGAYIIPKFEISKIKTSLQCEEINSIWPMSIDAIENDMLYINDAPLTWIAGKRTKIRFVLPSKGELTSDIIILSRHGGRVKVAIQGERELIYLNDYFFDLRSKTSNEDIIALKPRNGWNEFTTVACNLDGVLVDHDNQYEIFIKSISPERVVATCEHDMVYGDEVLVKLLPSSFDRMIEVRGQIAYIGEDNFAIEIKPNAFHEEILETEVLFWIGENNLWMENFHDLNHYLNSYLPEYMIPKAYHSLPHLPLTCNGKVDRNLLPEFQLSVNPKIEEVLTPTQQKLINIWEEILGLEQLSVDDNFFDIGGYSQLAVRSLLKVKEVFQVEIPIRDLFGTPTIRALANMIDSKNTTVSDLLANVDDKDLYKTYARQGIGERIATVRADKYYTKALGTTLEYVEAGKSIKVLDMVGGYGSTIFGHNHPDLLAQLIEQAQALLPTHTQHTNNVPAGKVAKKLSDMIGHYTKKSYISTLASTGTEATEAAIKHAKMAHYSKAKRYVKNTKNMCALLLDTISKGVIQLNPQVLFNASLVFEKTITTSTELVEALLEYNQNRLEQEPQFIALEHAFHGMSSGSISLTASHDFKKPFHWMELDIKRIAHTKAALESVIESSISTLYELSMDSAGEIVMVPFQWSRIAGMFIEPIQGEGGIFVLDRQFAQHARELSKQTGFPLIIDEIQCGMGRSGTFCASEQLGIAGDYYLFSKSLGGGLSKISAMVVESSQYEKDFGYYHGSTFAEDQPSSLIGLKALEILERDNIIQMAREKGEIFKQKLETLQRKYPNVFKDVRGMGLMLGIELTNLEHSESFLFRALANGGMEVLNHLIAGYLLNIHHIRIAPTKTRNTIRFLPSAYITIEEIERVVSALEEIAMIIHHANAGRLLSYTVMSSMDYTQPVKDYRPFHPAYRNDSDDGCVKVAHIGHVEDNEMLIKAEPSLMDIEPSLHEALLEVLFPVSKVTVTQSITVPSRTGDMVNLKVIGIPLTGKQIEEMMVDESKNILLDRIDDAVEMAKEQGCSMVGMGGYTSIVTLNCTTAATTDIALTSGNGFTTALAMEGVDNLMFKKGMIWNECDVAIVGAKGNIGSICAELIGEKSRSITLIGRKKNDDKLLEIAYTVMQQAIDSDTPIGIQIRGSKSFANGYSGMEELYKHLQDELKEASPINVGDSLYQLADAHVVITATNASQPVIFPHHVSQKTQIICDIATPNDVDVSISTQTPWIDLILGGLATLPNTHVNLHGTRLPENHVYGCVAETMLLGLEGVKSNFSFGAMSPDHVRQISSAAKKHDFKLGILKSIDLYGHHDKKSTQTVEVLV